MTTHEATLRLDATLDALEYAVKRWGRVDEDPALVLGAILEDLTTAADLLDETRGLVVAALREAGASWSTIGDALGTSKQAAAQRYGERRPPAVDDGPGLF